MTEDSLRGKNKQAKGNAFFAVFILDFSRIKPLFYPLLALFFLRFSTSVKK